MCMYGFLSCAPHDSFFMSEIILSFFLFFPEIHALALHFFPFLPVSGVSFEFRIQGGVRDPAVLAGVSLGVAVT